MKKFFPDETRSWKIFCMDIWKQLTTAGFSHTLNVFLSVYVSELTHMGNGCSWYLINLSMDLTVGVLVSYSLFKIVDVVAVKFGIEVSCNPLILTVFALGPQEWRGHRQKCLSD